ncbi:MAG: sulfatase-like hydrolase/transferase, partial [Caldilineaceae bacterium]|nr:sulfatase-like hydrolase/transferase [Caldilineaceae bacterium]
MTLPNILFMHSHNTGQFVQPYGHAVPTPNMQKLAEQGILFRRAFAAAPTCSPSRAAFLSGMWAHSAGMLGLAHRGFRMQDYGVHIVRTLKANGYHTALAGVEHTAPRLDE